MSVSVCTSSTESEFAHISDLLILLGTTASSSGHSRALKDATDWAERHVTGAMGGSIRRSVVRETLAGAGSQQLMVARTPLWKVQRLFDDTSTCEATEYCSTSFRIEDADAGFITRTGNEWFTWDTVTDWNLTQYPRPNAVRRRWLVEYEAGWQLTETSSTSNDWLTTTTGRTLPHDVERAVLLKAAEFYQGSASGMESMRVGPLAVNYSSEALDPAVTLLAQYRRL